jgi:phage terminase large subunit
MLADLPDTAAGKRLGKGLWVAAEGVIWTLPDSQIAYPVQDVFKRVVAGLDWGFVHAFACEVIGQTGAGRLAVMDEVYERGADLEDTIIPRLKELQLRYGITKFYADPSEPAYISKCRSAGLDVVGADNTVGTGIMSVSKAIRDGMTISPVCKGLLGEMPGYTWAQNRQGFQEKPIEINDDACDALRYGVYALDPISGAWGGGAAWGQS